MIPLGFSYWDTGCWMYGKPCQTSSIITVFANAQSATKWPPFLLRSTSKPTTSVTHVTSRREGWHGENETRRSVFFFRVIKNQMGLSENVGYIPNEIAIFRRDNDQQNHWVFRGTQHFQTKPNTCRAFRTLMSTSKTPSRTTDYNIEGGSGKTFDDSSFGNRSLQWKILSLIRNR